MFIPPMAGTAKRPANFRGEAIQNPAANQRRLRPSEFNRRRNRRPKSPQGKTGEIF
jgi:hypothetical protein